MRDFLRGLAEAVRAFRSVFGNPDLRRVELAFIGFNSAEIGTWIAILVFAYEAAYEAGGAAAAGAIGVVQLIPATFFGPVASLLGDRYRRERVLLAGYVIQALAMGLTAVVLTVEAADVMVYALAALTATTVTLTGPVQGSLLPSLARTPVGGFVGTPLLGSWQIQIRKEGAGDFESLEPDDLRRACLVLGFETS